MVSRGVVGRPGVATDLQKVTQRQRQSGAPPRSREAERPAEAIARVWPGQKEGLG